MKRFLVLNFQMENGKFLPSHSQSKWYYTQPYAFEREIKFREIFVLNENVQLLSKVKSEDPDKTLTRIQREAFMEVNELR